MTKTLPRITELIGSRPPPSVIAVVHELLDDEVQKFSEYMPKADFYLNSDRSLYNALSADGGGRWLKASSLLLRWRSYTHGIKSLWSVKGNVNGNEGNLLGGMLVVGAGDQGIVYQHLEDFGGYDYEKIAKAAAKISPQRQSQNSPPAKPVSVDR